MRYLVLGQYRYWSKAARFPCTVYRCFKFDHFMDVLYRIPPAEDAIEIGKSLSLKRFFKDVSGVSVVFDNVQSKIMSKRYIRCIVKIVSGRV